MVRRPTTVENLRPGGDASPPERRASTAAAVGITFVTPGTSRDVLTGFYRRVKPAGFWPMTAKAAGDTPADPTRRLLSGLRSTVLTALSLFLALIGFGKLVVPSPGQPWFLPWLSLAVSAALLPLWWRNVRREQRA